MFVQGLKVQTFDNHQRALGGSKEEVSHLVLLEHLVLVAAFASCPLLHVDIILHQVHEVPEVVDQNVFIFEEKSLLGFRRGRDDFDALVEELVIFVVDFEHVFVVDVVTEDEAVPEVYDVFTIWTLEN